MNVDLYKLNVGENQLDFKHFNLLGQDQKLAFSLSDKYSYYIFSRWIPWIQFHRKWKTKIYMILLLGEQNRDFNLFVVFFLSCSLYVIFTCAIDNTLKFIYDITIEDASTEHARTGDLNFCINGCLCCCSPKISL